MREEYRERVKENNFSVIKEVEINSGEQTIVLEKGDLIKTIEAAPRLTGVQGEFGPAGFLSQDSYDEITSITGQYPDDIMMFINMELLDIADSGSEMGKKIDAFDFRVTAMKKRDKLALMYPMKVYRDKALQTFYQNVITQVLNNL